MQGPLIFDLDPTGPWRVGVGGESLQVEYGLRSDALYSAITHAMRHLGRLEEWLDDTARASHGPVVVLTSLFPRVEDLRLVPPPRSFWPPPASQKLRWRGARYVPLRVALDLVAGQAPSETAWSVDGESQCLLPADQVLQSSPFHRVYRVAAPVDRLSKIAQTSLIAAIEFSAGSGLWGAARFRDDEAVERWSGPVQACLRYLGDTGFGGRKSSGWGGAAVRFAGDQDLFGTPSASEAAAGPVWLLSLYSPSPQDQVDWSRGDYDVEERGGRIASPSAPALEKKLVRFVREGSVLHAASTPVGVAPDVAPEGYPHPVYRSGFAFSIPLAEAS